MFLLGEDAILSEWHLLSGGKIPLGYSDVEEAKHGNQNSVDRGNH